jgi:hypothetical protein
MTGPRDRKWLSFQGLAGGLTMFAVEALIVVGLAAVALLTSVLILAIL